ncbi:MAG: hypothetical protein LUG95_00385 [Clostridiales bacterium]|nr:hypothetical protein [Clostridiales bacterium]
MLVDGDDYVTSAVELKSGVTLFISNGSALCSNKTSVGYEKNQGNFASQRCKGYYLNRRRKY